MSWVFPNAPLNHEAMTNAWSTPTSFSPIPVGRSLGEQEEDDDEEGEDEILASVEYLCGLVDEEVKRGVRLERIVIGGFSQGCAVSLVAGLAGRYQGALGGVVGLSGYLPRGTKIKGVIEGYASAARNRKGQEEKMKIFLAHGSKDMLVPMRVFRDAKARVVQTAGEDTMEVHEYEGLGHGTRGDEFREMCTFLERVIPA
jgi:predicted esterase